MNQLAFELQHIHELSFEIYVEGAIPYGASRAGSELNDIYLLRFDGVLASEGLTPNASAMLTFLKGV